MNKKILWFWLLLLQINFLVIWFRGDDKDYSIYSLIIGGGISFGLAVLLIYTIYMERKNRTVKIFHGILIFIVPALLGGLIHYMLIVPLMQASLCLFLLTLLFTSFSVFKKKDLPELES